MKETDSIKERLNDYVNLRNHIDNQTNRLEAITMIGGANMNPNSGGSGHSSKSKIERLVEKKIALQKKIDALTEREEKERIYLEGIVNQIRNPNEQLVIEMRYFDEMSWLQITEALFSMEDDYDEKIQNYKRDTFRIHGRALVSLNKIITKRNS
jgi:hypothetical protein